ncbi:hypothetical protein [Pseudomonas sp. RIT623]|uniref:hypothetical protein n=1 Tax=Pseudomonas sp. RIT623 TaxID=2559075 RepID=UPI00106FC720|nr:hypothetical protein [Pseudomonas sp. RIT623]TFF43106.1 hypothetical protein E3U47_00785 [Pseudomonas sp. RIT623]
MNIARYSLPLLLALVFQGSAMAHDGVFTAHIAADGRVLSQSPQWISQVQAQPQANYFTQYKLSLDKDQLRQAPGFCSVSPLDASSYDRQLHGAAKVIGKPLADKLTVQTQLVDTQGPSGDNSLEFQVLCVR